MAIKFLELEPQLVEEPQRVEELQLVEEPQGAEEPELAGDQLVMELNLVAEGP